MRPKNRQGKFFPVVIALVVAVTLALPGQPVRATGSVQEDKKSGDDAPGRQVVAYYFHGTKRCSTCMKLEKYSLEALQSGFATEMEDGLLVWKAVNYDEHENRHFVEEYELYTKALILVEMRDGRQVRFENLDRIWELVHNRSAFSGYVERSVREFLEPD